MRVNTLHSQHLKDKSEEGHLMRAQGKEHGRFNSAWSEDSAVHKMPRPANSMETVVDSPCKDDCGAVIKSEEQEFVEDVARHRAGCISSARTGRPGPAPTSRARPPGPTPRPAPPTGPS